MASPHLTRADHHRQAQSDHATEAAKRLANVIEQASQQYHAQETSTTAKG
jgi:hypothetical protein